MVPQLGTKNYSLQMPLRLPRSYPSGLGERIHQIYQAQLASPARGQMRLRVEVDGGLSDRELFESLPIGDVWDDAGMRDLFEYLYGCKHCRTIFL